MKREKHIQGKNEVTLRQVINICAGISPGNGIKESCNEMESGKFRLNPSERSEPAVQRSDFPHKVQMTSKHPTQLKVGGFSIPTAYSSRWPLAQ